MSRWGTWCFSLPFGFNIYKKKKKKKKKNICADFVSFVIICIAVDDVLRGRGKGGRGWITLAGLM